MTSIAIGPMGQSVAEDPKPVVILTKEPAGLRIELRIESATNPAGLVVGRTIPVNLVKEVRDAVDFFCGQWGLG